MNRKVEHYLLVGHSRNALRNYSNQIAAAVWKLASGETGQLKTECSFWPKTVVAPRTKKHKTWQMNVPFLHCPLMFFLTRCRIYDNLKIWMGGMNYVNVSPTYFRSFFSAGLSQQLMAGLTANGQNKAHPSFRFLVFTLHQELSFSRIFVGERFTYLSITVNLSWWVHSFHVGGHFDWQIVISTASDSSLGKSDFMSLGWKVKGFFWRCRNGRLVEMGSSVHNSWAKEEIPRQAYLSHQFPTGEFLSENRSP